MGPLVVERSRGILRVAGRDPVKMIQGLATADITAVTRDQGVYTAFLTPKGRMVADARVVLAPDDPDVLLLDTAPDAVGRLAEHLARFVPPLFARAEDVSEAWAVVGVYGPDADSVASTALGRDAPADAASAASGVDPEAMEDAPDRVLSMDPGFALRTFLTGDPGWDLFVPSARREELIDGLLDAGGRPGDPDALESLRVAAGVPRWGRELSEQVIPLEVGYLDRAISQDKGCYTGQEVIVRILHRGHVNRYLRRLEFEAGAPEAGTELFEEGVEKPRGTVTSAVENDAGAIGLGFVRREVEPPAELRVGSPAGDRARVTALE
jgi:folate-binding protein YgfZ